MAQSGSIIQVIGAGFDMDFVLPEIASGDEGFHITFIIIHPFTGVKNLEISTHGAAGASDKMFLYMNTANTYSIDVDGGDVLRTAADIPQGTMIRLTCAVGDNEVWIAEVLQPAGTAASIEDGVA